MKTIISFVKKETVLTIAALLALLSACFVPLDRNYISYVDFKVLSLLFCLMCVMAGYQSAGFFERLGRAMLKRAKNARQLTGILVALCFFSSMLITNDVALITFVPFTIMVLVMAERQNLLVPVIVLQTLAANLGSMLTPIGNPQNLYLYSIAGFSLTEFMRIMFPYTFISFSLLSICIFFVKPLALKVPQFQAQSCLVSMPLGRYTLLFLLCIATVLHLLPYQLVFGIVLFVLLLWDRQLLKQVDYFLLLTFLCFFVFIGNVGRMDPVVSLLHSLLTGFELEASVLASQVVSNVPAALLLSGFTDRHEQLLVGVNLGGLGTLIASLASLISYKFYVNTKGSDKLRYLLVFTLLNILFLIVLMAAAQYLL